jgi:DNA-binding NarL/FixJ family response regulator
MTGGRSDGQGASRGVAASRNRPAGLFIVSNIRFLREGLAEVLAQGGVFTIAGLSSSVGHALAAVRSRPTQIILIDSALPDALSGVAHFRQMVPDAHIVALGLDETAEAVIAWAEAGSSGYIPRNTALSDVVTSLLEIIRGEQGCSARIASGLLHHIATGRQPERVTMPAGIPPMLTPREAEVLGLICDGLSNKEIARQLQVGLATTKSHVHNLLSKLSLKRRSQVHRWRSEGETRSQ